MPSDLPRESIAIVGRGGIFPGCVDLDDFWQTIATARDNGRVASSERWFLAPERALTPGDPRPDAVYSTWCCPLETLPPLADGPPELAGLDPLCRIGLAAARQAWSSALTEQVDRRRVGVILGHIVLPTESTSALGRDALVREFARRLLGDTTGWETSSWSSRNWSAAALPAQIIAAALNLGGPAFTLDAACASSLYALKLACNELQAGRLDAVLAGGLSRPDSQYTQMGFSQLQALSKRGRCAPLSSSADGLVVGEGAGAFVLKRLSDALEQGDRIQAVIAGIGLSNDRGANLLAPHSEGQLRAMQAAYQRAGWRPGDVDLIECHATGTPVGDAVELQSLHALWSEEAVLARRCVLGSVKSNVGHLLTGAGAASLMKLLMAFERSTLPPTANFDEPAAALQPDGTPFRVLKTSENWGLRAAELPRRAAINAFGFGGINAHVLLEEWRPQTRAVPAPVVIPSPRVAIVGLAAQVGSWSTLRDVQRFLHGDVDNMQPQPAQGWGLTATTSSGYAIHEVALPVGEFRIPPLEIEEMLPQQQLMLQVTAAALKDAGVSRELGNRAGVFVGIGLDPNTTNFHGRWSLAEFAAQWAEQLRVHLTQDELSAWITRLRDAFGPPLTANRVMGNLGGIVASRLAREFDVGGPSFTLSSDELSGVHALQTALRALQLGELDLAVVGAVDFPGDMRIQTVQPTTSQPFADAGLAFILQRYDDAVRDGRPIYAVLDDIQQGSSSESARPMPVWSGAATGLLQVLRETLELHRGVHDDEFDLSNRADGPRQRTVPVTSNTGDNVAVTLSAVGHSEVVGLADSAHPTLLPAQLFVFDGDTDEDIIRALDDCTAMIAVEHPLERSARRWFRRRLPDSSKSLAAVLLVRTVDEWHAGADELRERLTNRSITDEPSRNDNRVFFDRQPLGRDGRLACVFPGSGSHFLGMGRELLAAFPQVLQRQHRENERLRDQFRTDLIWHGASTEAIGRDHKAMIFGQVALGTALCDWLALFGVRPRASIGYSLGESAALFGLRAWTDRDEMLRRMEAESLFGSDLVAPFDAARRAWQIPAGEEVPWIAGVIDRPADVVRDAVNRRTRAYLLIVNTPNQCVIGGDRTQIERIVADLQANFVPLAAPSTVHCEILDQVARDYVALHRMPTVAPAGIDFYSTATGQPYGLSSDAAAGAILAQAVSTIDFAQVVRNAHRDGVRFFLEIGPGNSCTRMIAETLANRPYVARALCPATSDPVRHALGVLAELIVQRVPVDLSLLYGYSMDDGDSRPQIITPCAGQPFDPPLPPAKTGAVSPAPAPVSPPRPLKAPGSTTVVMPAPAPLPTRTASPARQVPIAAPPSTTKGVASAAAVAVSEDVVAWFDRWMTERNAAHAAFLRFSQQTQELTVELMGRTDLATVVESPEIADVFQESRNRKRSAEWELPAVAPRAMGYEQCLEFAIGSIGKVLGPQFAEIDRFPTRVRLPDVPLMLVDRITEIEGEPLSMTHGRVVTEHDIHADDWYLDGGRIPTCLAVESGQADLFLSGWLGIDFQTRGLACYRLLDAVVTFHDELPGPGKTIRYDIRINRFFRQGETHLFRFEFDATVDGRPLLTMREGCAGFFTDTELAAGQGIIHTAFDKQPRPGVRPPDWNDPVPLRVESYNDQQLAQLRAGDLAACFGSAFADLPLDQPETLPSGRLRLVDRILKLDPAAGKYGLGQIVGEADIHPDDWFLTCHFCDDQVMPGTLMYECCLHTLRVYLLRLGWICEHGQIAYEPVPGVKSRLKCRGQVTASTKKVWYEITLKEYGYSQESRVEGREPDNSKTSPLTTPYCLADALMYADGKPIVEITDMSVRLSGLTRAEVERLWSGESRVESPESRASGTVASVSVLALDSRPSTLDPLFDAASITEFAIGKPSRAFGERYRVFDEGRVIARLPGPPFQFLDRITRIENCEPWKLAAGGVIEAEYDVPVDAWYFSANRSRTMPFAVLLEAALQPCGWLAAYLGSALTSDVDLSFRNLGGKATQLRAVTPESGTLTTTVKITSVSQSAGMIIQHYDFDLRCRGEPVYTGKTYFGFFSKVALTNQVGIRDAAVYQPTDAEQRRSRSFLVSMEPPFPDERFRMVHRVDALVMDGGPHGLGYIRGSVDVDPSFWFFKAHFFQDPVWPGSLGLESFLQLVKVYAAERGGAGSRESKVESQEPEKSEVGIRSGSRLSTLDSRPSTPHEWIYRGQVLPTDRTVTVTAVITAVDDASRTVTANGFLSIDGRVIYQMIDFTTTSRGDFLDPV